MRLQLKISLWERGVPAYKTAFEAGIHPNKVSKIIHGLAEPTPEEKLKLASILNKPVNELFPEEVKVVQ